MNETEKELDNLFKDTIEELRRNASYGKPNKYVTFYKDAYVPDEPYVNIGPGCFWKRPTKSDW